MQISHVQIFPCFPQDYRGVPGVSERPDRGGDRYPQPGFGGQPAPQPGFGGRALRSHLPVCCTADKLGLILPNTPVPVPVPALRLNRHGEHVHMITCVNTYVYSCVITCVYSCMITCVYSCVITCAGQTSY